MMAETKKECPQLRWAVQLFNQKHVAQERTKHLQPFVWELIVCKVPAPTILLPSECPTYQHMYI